MNNPIVVSYNSRPGLNVYLWVMGILTFITSLLIMVNEMNSNFAGKTISLTYMLALLSVSAISCGKHLKKGGDTYNLGMAGVITCSIAFFLFLIFIFGEMESLTYIKALYTVVFASAGFGYICGIATIQNTSAFVKGLKISAIACVSAVTLFYIYMVFDNPFLAFGGLNGLSRLGNIAEMGKIFIILLLLSFSLTLLAKIQSMIDYTPPQEILFDYEKEALEQAAEKQEMPPL
jgi:hypothetical protein